YARVRRGSAMVMIGIQSSVDERNRDHVLQAVIPVGRIVEGSCLADDADRGIMRGENSAFNVGKTVLHEQVQLHRAFHRRLSMELGWEGDLEEDVFHHIRTVRALERERPALEEDIV